MCPGAEGVDSVGKMLACNYEDLGLDSQYLQNLGVMMHTYNDNTSEQTYVSLLSTLAS